MSVCVLGRFESVEVERFGPFPHPSPAAISLGGALFVTQRYPLPAPIKGVCVLVGVLIYYGVFAPWVSHLLLCVISDGLTSSPSIRSP